ncbi:MAG: hypothetical protein PHI66_04445 [Candidatus Pacebacteria bacterium]|nr:hypothetical protein [Candidatus Paceibacterota bacterium]
MENLKKIVIFNLVLIFCLTAFLKVKADSANTALSLQITGGELSVTAPEEASFIGKSFSFDGQTSVDNPIGVVEVTDMRGSRAGWSIDITAEDWNDGLKVMDYNGDGTTTGQLSMDIPTLSAVSTIKGDSASSLSMGVDDSFDSTTSTIKLISAAIGDGSGQYTISGIKTDQFIPGNQPAGSYLTNLTLTIQ